MEDKLQNSRDPLTEKVIGCAIEAPIHQAQILTYMKLSKIHIGLLINFHQTRLIDGLKRFIL